MSLLLRSAAVGLLAVWLAACSSGGTTASPVATNQVDLPRSYLFAPADITVPVGTTVTWTNHDEFTHSVRMVDDGGKIMIMKPGESVSFTFDKAGLHHYDCSFHPQNMKGTVTVTASGG
ncbi:MAG TPA: plastocyanin/azurin family copper-binding protein [Candidatus Limnocylindria bacterium]|jgi:plastocyanin|nr:plastocyanin/azurin family copper-binding protein [Candidatus Limnocylindria bacterium]